MAELFPWRGKTVQALFEEQARLSPHAVAVEIEDRSLTYEELDRRASSLAGHLQALGVQAGDIVALSIERSLEMVIALLGILKAGGVYWGLEDHLPRAPRLQRLRNSPPRLLLARRASAPEFQELIDAGHPETALCQVGIVEEMLASPGALLFSVEVSAEAPACLAYTSGSSGRPKGVQVPHRGISRLVKGGGYVSLTPDETLLHFSPLSFDASTFELWGALLNGGRVVLMPTGQMSPEAVARVIETCGITTLWLSAGLFHLMVDTRLESLKPLRQLLAGGDVLSPSHVLKAMRALPGCRIINGYGPTENTTFTCCHTVTNEAGISPSVPIGRPIAGTQVYVLDERQQPVAEGMTGELYTGGDGVACGYVNQPELTAESFLPDPFAGRPGAKMYRTGDVARWRKDGSLEFLGRLDSQVKIRGYRVEPGEIELALRNQPEIRDAVVIVAGEGSEQKRLVACLVAGADKLADQELSARLAERLPSYMQPQTYVWLDRLPLTPNGKVDRTALPRGKAGEKAASTPANQPVSLLELKLLGIWRELFGKEEIARQDNFFALGGDSLLAGRLVLEVAQHLGCELPVAVVFAAPTVEQLALRILSDSSAPRWSSLVPLQPEGARAPLFLMHGVKGDVFCFVELARLLAPGQPVYGLQAEGLDGRTPRHETLEAMAAHYVEEILSFQPQGPYHLGGFSLGGMIAYEAARQLRLRGHEVALLALIDTEPLGILPRPLYLRTMAAFVPRRTFHHLRRWWSLPVREKGSYLLGRCRALAHWLRRSRTTDNPPAPADAAVADADGDHCLAAGLAYHVQEYGGAADVLVTADSDASWMHAWNRLVRGSVRFHPMPGGHLQLLARPAVVAVAETLKRLLAEKQGSTRKS